VTDTSARYDAEKAAAYAVRSPARARAEAALIAAVLRAVGPLGPTLDVPCGSGRLRELVAAHGGTWTGADLSAAMLARAGARPLVRAALPRLPFADRAFDTVLCCRFLHHVAPGEQRRVVTELARVCRAHLILTAFHPWSAHRFTRLLRGGSRHATAPRHLDAWLRALGFLPVTRRRQGPLRDLWVGGWQRDDTT
jgi:SAM-dependent methyltransferase